MMRVPNYVAPSLIPGAGIGLFCAGAIAAGDLLWIFDPGLDIEIGTMPADPVVADFLKTYAYMPRNGEQRWILCGDNARFFNHSPTPNVIGDEWISHAAGDLAAGSELTIDYGMFDRRPIAFWI